MADDDVAGGPTDGSSDTASRGESGQSAGSAEGVTPASEGDGKPGGEAADDEQDVTAIRNDLSPNEIARELSQPDIRFLRAIREVNETPEGYPSQYTDTGVTPATTRVLRECTALTDNQIRYRFRSAKAKIRQYGDDGLVTTHSGRITSAGPGPKSAELTSLGEAVIEHAIGGTEVSNDVEPIEGELLTKIRTLQEEVGKLSNRVDDLERLDERIAALEDSPTGALNDEYSRQLDGVIASVELFLEVLEALNIPIEEYAETELSPADKNEIARRVAEQLAEVEP